MFNLAALDFERLEDDETECIRFRECEYEFPDPGIPEPPCREPAAVGAAGERGREVVPPTPLVVVGLVVAGEVRRLLPPPAAAAEEEEHVCEVERPKPRWPPVFVFIRV